MLAFWIGTTLGARSDWFSSLSLHVPGGSNPSLPRQAESIGCLVRQFLVSRRAKTPKKKRLLLDFVVVVAVVSVFSPVPMVLLANLEKFITTLCKLSCVTFNPDSIQGLFSMSSAFRPTCSPLGKPFLIGPTGVPLTGFSAPNALAGTGRRSRQIFKTNM